jgi:hypothetical protein
VIFTAMRGSLLPYRPGNRATTTRFAASHAERVTRLKGTEF